MRTCLLCALATTCALVFAAACGGGKQGDSKTPDTPPVTTATVPSAEPSATTTTTTTLGDGGDLQGAKLASSSSTTIENKSDAGPPKGAKGNEPGRSREDIQAIIVARRDDARTCYDEGLKKNPSIEGDLDIKWTIDVDGNVTEIAVDAAKSTIRDEGVATCIMAIIKKVKFAKSNKGFESRTHYPFNFHPKAGQVGKGGAQPAQK